MKYFPGTSGGFRSATISSDSLLPGIHGLRGIAALSVVLFHLVHVANLSTPEGFGFIDRDFGKGVHLFFVLSAFSLMHSTGPSLLRSTWVKEYAIKRFFRIAPLFYLCLLYTIPVTSHVDWQRIALNLSFTFGLAPWTGIVWGGWSVGVEMLFYVVFPLLLLGISTRRGGGILLLISLAVSFASFAVLQKHFESAVTSSPYNWAYFSFAPNFCFFAFGIYAFLVAREASADSRVLRMATTTLAIGLFLALSIAPVISGALPNTILWSAAFCALVIWQGKWPSRWCANRFFEYLGERSYSLYLLHAIAIYKASPLLRDVYANLFPHLDQYAYFVCAACLLVPLLLLSEVSYRLVEIPSIRIGQRLTARIRVRLDDKLTPST